MTNAQLEIIIEDIMNGKYLEDKELDLIESLLRKELKDPNILDYIFSSEYNLTSKEIVQLANSYKPIIL